MDVLDNELVQKYFKCDNSIGCLCAQWPVQSMSWHILEAMQEPTNAGDRMLYLNSDTLGGMWIEETIATANVLYFHPFTLRLPDRFQKKVDPVEEKIKEISSRWSVPPYQAVERELRALVELARKGR